MFNSRALDEEVKEIKQAKVVMSNKGNQEVSTTKTKLYNKMIFLVSPPGLIDQVN